jgi:hypothetical protein
MDYENGWPGKCAPPANPLPTGPAPQVAVRQAAPAAGGAAGADDQAGKSTMSAVAAVIQGTMRGVLKQRAAREWLALPPPSRQGACGPCPAALPCAWQRMRAGAAQPTASWPMSPPCPSHPPFGPTHVPSCLGLQLLR